MTSNDQFGQTLTAWLHEEAGHRVPDHLGEVLVQTAATRQRKWWSSPERWLPLDTATDLRGRIAAPRALVWLALIALIVLAIVGTAVFTGALRAPSPVFGLATNGRILIADGATLKSYAADGTDPKTIKTLTNVAQDLVVSHDGSRIAMVMLGTDERTDIVRASDGSTTRLAVPAGTIAMGSPSSWSPDDQRIAFLTFDGTREHLVVAKADGSSAAELDADHSTSKIGLWSPAWSPDGQWIAFVAADRTTEVGDIYVIRPDGKDLHQVTTSPVSAGGGVSWAPDPSLQRLLYTGAGATMTAHVYDVATDVDRLVASSFWPTWSPTGDRISSWGTEVRVTADVLAGIDRPVIAITAWADGKGCQEHPELKDKNFCGPAAFSPDGKRLIAPDVTGTSVLSVMADGTAQPIVIPLDTNVVDLGNPVVWLPVR